MIITIDGPTASGKSTVAQLLAGDMHTMYLNTGLLYRAFAYALVHEYGYVQERLATPLHEDVMRIYESTSFCYSYDREHGASLSYHGEDITNQLKSACLDQWASIVSTSPEVRLVLLKLQRDLANKHDVIADGRDCGTVVFPNADYKFFITADNERRARRWQKDQEKRGVLVTLDEALQSIISRDDRDSKRAIAPLVVPVGAIILDTSELTALETVSLIKKHLHVRR